MIWVALMVFLFFSTTGFAQYFDLGQDAASLKWRQIRTQNFQVIYPDYYEVRAQYFAAGLEQVAARGTKTLASSPRRLPVIFHAQSVVSNAMVPWAPRRMEIYTAPPQDMYSQPWLDQLILHEYRHVQQIEKMNQGFTRGLYYLLGEQAAAAMIGLFVPFWFLEGDAVAVETGWSYSGRGRDPSFTLPLRGQLSAHGIYSYDKAVFGSYKDFVPDHYILGYHLVSRSRLRYGSALWDQTLNTVARKPFMLVPFNYGLKKITGMPKAKLYQSILSELDSTWRINNPISTNIHESPFITLKATGRRPAYSNYRHPAEIPGSGILTEKSSLDDVNRYVIIDPDGNESILCTPGFNFSQTLSVSGDLMAWSAMKQDPRWENRSYSVIRVYDMRTGKSRELTHRTRIFSPALSAGTDRIAAVELDSLDESSLVILDAIAGTILQKISAPVGTFLMTPRWTEGDGKIVTIGVSEKGKAVLVCDLTTTTWSALTPWSFTELCLPCPAGAYIYYTGGYSGTENIYAVDTSGRSIYQVTDAILGATDAFVTEDRHTLYYSRYTGDGYRIARMPVIPAEWKPLGEPVNSLAPVADGLTSMEEYIFDCVPLADSHYLSRPYRDGANLFNVHSWGPFYIDADNQEAYPGVSIMSQNKLSTAFTNLGYRYNLNEKEGTYFADFSYRGFYPIMDLSYEIGKRENQTLDSLENRIDYSWREDQLRALVRIPFQYLLSRWIIGWQPTVGTALLHINHGENLPPRFASGSFQVMEYRLLLYGQIESSYRDLYPKWGLTLDMNFRHTPFGGNSLGTIGSAEAYIYLPGLVRHHGVRLYVALQQKDPGEYRFADLINYPRGYSGIYLDKAFSFSAGYKFPFWYPDLALGSVVYLKRLKAAVFWDYAKGESANGKQQAKKKEYQSMGIDLTADMHVLRFLAPFDLGLRTIYLPEESGLQFQFLFSIDINSFYKN
ncbi:MAG: hypothetical protein PHD61_00555 [Bacteroidales bacterium]|nr:hypothetical protein [Bacteroidales bacterium]